MNKMLLLAFTILFSFVSNSIAETKTVIKKSNEQNVLKKQPLSQIQPAMQQIKTIPAKSQFSKQSPYKQLVKDHEMIEFKEHIKDNPIVFNKLSGKRAIKIRAYPGDLIQTSGHFALEKKHTDKNRKDENGKIIWKIRVKRDGKAWIKIRDKKTGIHMYHFNIEKNRIKKINKTKKKVK